MTQKEHDDALRILRQEFERLWEQKLNPHCKALGLETWGEAVARDLSWIAFTHGKIPVVDKE